MFLPPIDTMIYQIFYEKLSLILKLTHFSHLNPILEKQDIPLLLVERFVPYTLLFSPCKVEIKINSSPEIKINSSPVRVLTAARKWWRPPTKGNSLALFHQCWMKFVWKGYNKSSCTNVHSK